VTTSSPTKRLGFFTRLLDKGSAGERYRLAAEQIIHAERHGFDTAWVAQHHFHEAEGGLPSPLVFLSHVAARTSRIRLGTGVITLPLEHPIRAAEDAVVLDLLSGGRLEVGVGTGGTPSSFTAFGHDSANRSEIYERYLAIVRDAWSGKPLEGGDTLYPAEPSLNDRVWQATFSHWGGARAGKAGDGLMLSRTQPRPKENPQASLSDIQHPIIDAYLEALPRGREPRIMASRTLFVADSRKEALRLAEQGLRNVVGHFIEKGHFVRSDSRPRHPCGNTGRRHRILKRRHRSVARNGHRLPGALCRSAAFLHPALDRADRQHGRSRSRLAGTCRAVRKARCSRALRAFTQTGA